MSEQPKCADGGFIPGDPVPVPLAADECLILISRESILTCVREGHPTPTSDCTKQHWIRHQGAAR